MAPPSYITETVIMRVKEGINLDHDAHDSAAVQQYISLLDILKSQKGVISQLWGHQIEDPKIFVWSVDWESADLRTEFMNSEHYAPFIAGILRVFDLSAGPPFITLTRFTTDANAALRSGVTEIAFLTLPEAAGEEAMKTMDDAMKPIMHNVQAIGKATGAAVGWVFDVAPPGSAARAGDKVALHGVFGYNRIEDHYTWREAPEHAAAIEIMESLNKDLGLQDADVFGSAMFHVKFRDAL